MPLILVTGGAGYIGSHIIVSLINNGFEVISVDNFINAFPTTFEGIKKITGKKIINYNLNICNEKSLEKIFTTYKNITGIIHCAGLKSVSESIERPSFYYHNNILSTINLLNSAKKYNIGNLVFSSSCCVYGETNLPIVHEQLECKPSQTPYGQTKQISEQLISEATKNSQLKAIALRYFNPIGNLPYLYENPKRKPYNFFPTLREHLKNNTTFVINGNDYSTIDGTAVRDYVHIEDIAIAHVLAIKRLTENKEAPPFEAFNLGTGKGLSLLQVLQNIEKTSGKKINYIFGNRREGDIAIISTDPTKAKNILNWQPKKTIEEAIQSTFKQIIINKERIAL